MEHYYNTFVSIGNAKQQFSRLLQAVYANIDLLPKPVLIQNGHTSFTAQNCKVINFINMDDFLIYIQHAELVILHGGVGSISQALKYKKYPIVMPRIARFSEHVNDHQVAFTKAFSDAHRVIMVNNAADLTDAIPKALQHRPASNVSKPSSAMAKMKNLFGNLCS